MSGHSRARGKGAKTGTTTQAPRGAPQKAGNDAVEMAEEDAEDDSADKVPSRSRRRVSPLPTDHITRLTSGNAKPSKPKFDNSEVKEPTHSPRKKAGAPILSGT